MPTTVGPVQQVQVNVTRDPAWWNPRVERAANRGVARVRARLTRLRLHALALDLTLDDNPGGGVCARVELRMPEEVLPASVADADPARAVHQAFGLLLSRFHRYAAHLDPARWTPLERITADPARRARLARLLRRALPALFDLAEHHLTMLRTEQELPEVWPDAADVVDAALLEGLPGLSERADADEALLALMDALRSVLEREVEQAERAPNVVANLEGLPDERPPVPGENREDDELPEAFAGPPEPLGILDLTSDDDAPLPDEIVAAREARERLVDALYTLPERQRPVFTQAVVDGLRRQTVAALWRRPLAEIDAVIEAATEDLAWRLGLDDEAVLAAYRELGDRLRAERSTAPPPW